LARYTHGWRGIHSIDAIANGDGPATFTDGMVQEFQWARSLVMIFLGVTPKYLGKMPFSLQFQFLFGQQHFTMGRHFYRWRLFVLLPV
jgi:cellulose synthase (UDP-forming)